MDKTVLVPVDGSDHSYQAFSLAVSEHSQATIVALHAVHPHTGEYAPDTPGGAERAQSDVIMEQITAAFERQAAPAASLQTVVEEGSPRHVVVSHANEEDVDRVVMGTRGLTGVKRFVLGSVADAVIRQVNIPVTVVPSQTAEKK